MKCSPPVLYLQSIPSVVTVMSNKSAFVQRYRVFLYYTMYSAPSLNIYVKVPLSVFLNVPVFRKKILKEMIKFKQAANIQIILVQ